MKPAAPSQAVTGPRVWVLDPTGQMEPTVMTALSHGQGVPDAQLFGSLPALQRGFRSGAPEVVLICALGYSQAAATAVRVLRENHPGVAIVIITEGEAGPAIRDFVITGAQDVIALGMLTPALLDHVIGLAIVRCETEIFEARVATPDPLTGLVNRESIDRRLDRALRHTAMTTSQRSVAVVFIDLDGFKGINDSHGHAAGDHVLREVAQRLMASVRPEDAVGRHGGDEFVVVLEGQGVEGVVDLVSYRCLQAISRPIAWNGSTLSLSASVGYAVSAASIEPATLVDRADRAQYIAKHAGGSRVVAFDPDFEQANPAERHPQTVP